MPNNQFKDFWIAVGQPGAYSNSMVYTDVFGVFERFKIRIKHSPYSMLSANKNVVVQSWKDEIGDDVWLPQVQGITPGTYSPAITQDAVEFSPTFVYFANNENESVNDYIRDFINTINGRWLKIWDEYTQIGYVGVYLLDVEDDPRFKRRNYDHVEFTLKFKINGPGINTPFDGVSGITYSETPVNILA